MKILVTGGGGFLGSHLVEKWLEAGHELTVLNTHSADVERNLAAVIDRINLIWDSITNKKAVERSVIDTDVVVHMAARIHVAESLAGPIEYIDVNVGGTMNVLEAARKTDTRVIYSSTYEVYGQAEGLLTEDSPLVPYSPYAAAKAGADRMCFAYHKSYGLNVTIVRPSNVFGPRQKSGRGGAVIPIFATLAARRQPLTIHGTGEQRREYAHVDDVTKAYDLILNRDDLSGETLNVGSGERPSIVEIAQFISQKTGVGIVHEKPRPAEVIGFELDSSKIRKLGFVPRVSFWDGLDRYLNESSSSLRP